MITATETEHQCRKCKQTKPRSAFHRNCRRPHGIQYFCIACVRKRPATIKAKPAASLDAHIEFVFAAIFNACPKRRDAALAKWRSKKRCDNPEIEAVVRQSIREFHLKGQQDATEDD